MVPKRKRSSTTSTFPRDVFLSFRGDDTRFKFTDHLYSALNKFGIDTFRDDDQIVRGETIHPSLLKAIEESKVSVVVLSENYANSKWCLDELVKIMKCRREKGQIVLPVFYHVDPSDVRRQTGSFGKAFAGYRNVAEERLQRWRAALTEAGLLSGWHVEHGYIIL